MPIVYTCIYLSYTNKVIYIYKIISTIIVINFDNYLYRFRLTFPQTHGGSQVQVPEQLRHFGKHWTQIVAQFPVLWWFVKCPETEIHFQRFSHVHCPPMPTYLHLHMSSHWGNDTSDFADVEAVKAASRLEDQLMGAASVASWQQVPKAMGSTS